MARDCSENWPTFFSQPVWEQEGVKRRPRKGQLKDPYCVARSPKKSTWSALSWELTFNRIELMMFHESVKSSRHCKYFMRPQDYALLFFCSAIVSINGRNATPIPVKSPQPTPNQEQIDLNDLSPQSANGVWTRTRGWLSTITTAHK